MHILVVDDSTTMRRILSKSLARMGFPHTFEAPDGPSALEHLGARPVDLVIVDWHMPGMSGIDLVRAIRSTPAMQHVPVLMVTANAAPDDIVRAVRSGITGYVVKPFTSETLAQKVADVLRAGEGGQQPSQPR